MRAKAWIVSVLGLIMLVPTPSSSQPTVLAAPIQFSGRIEMGNRRPSDERRYQDHAVRLQGGQRYRVSVMAARFDAMVEVIPAGETEIIAENDDNGSSQNPRTTFQAPRSGTYVLRALGFFPDAAGSYYLRIERALPFPPPLPTQRPARRAEETTVWNEYTGSLTLEDPSLDGLHFDDYLVTVDAGEQILIRLDSEDFDPFVQIFAAADRENDVLASDDDSGGDRNSFLLFTPDQPGDYIVRVIPWGTALTRSFLGDYRLRIGR